MLTPDFILFRELNSEKDESNSDLSFDDLV